jgi:hypothetical protein
LCGGVVSACLLLEPNVTLSTVEAEYQDLNLVVQQSILLRQVLRERGFLEVDATLICKDNQACIFIATTNNISSRTKRPNIRLFFVRDMHRTGMMQIYYVPIHEMLVDISTNLQNSP